MLNWQQGKNRIFTKAISLIMAQVFFITAIAEAVPSERSLFRNKRVNYKAIQEQRENELQKKNDILSGKTNKSIYTKDKRQLNHRINLSALKDLSSIYIPDGVGRVIEVYDAKRIENREQMIALYFISKICIQTPRHSLILPVF